jgi:hypothetical protein
LDVGAESLVREPKYCLLGDRETGSHSSSQNIVSKTMEAPEAWDFLKTEGPLIRTIEPSNAKALEPNTIGVVEECFDSMGDYSQTDPSVLCEIVDSLANFIPTYKDVLNRSPLPIYSGGKPLPSSLVLVLVDEISKRASGD